MSEGARAERRLGWLLCAPAIIVMAAVTAYPIGYAIWLSLQRYDLRFPAEGHLIGLANYATVLTSNLRRGAHRGPDPVRDRHGGRRLQLAVRLDPGHQLPGQPAPNGSGPLTSQWPAIFIIIGAEIWKTTPFMALLLLAGVSLVPDELLRAAKVDGASAWQRFTQIMLPMMKPAILVALLFRTLDAFRIFDNIYILTAGANNTRSVSILGYDNLFTALNLGVGSAISVLIFVAVAIIAFVFVKGFGTAAPGQEVARG